MVRDQFPIFSNQQLVYLDSASTTQKPLRVLEAMDSFSQTSNANVHRGFHSLADRATDAYEAARSTAQKFLHAASAEEIIFTKSSTEAVNLVAHCWAAENMQAKECVALSLLEHHSNIVPWFMLKESRGTSVAWIEITADGELDMEAYQTTLKKNTVRLVAITGQSNVLGVRPNLREIIALAHTKGALVLVDAAQLAAHHRIDVQELDCDFLVLSGHKIYGPMGIGVLYAKREHQEKMAPWLGGGGMVQSVTQEGFVPADPPIRFEGGTPNVAGAVGLAAAMEWMMELPWNEVEVHEHELTQAALETLQSVEGLAALGPGNAEQISGCISFTVEGIHPHDLTELLGKRDICLRAGHHCAQPLHDHLGIPASTRLSIGLYNTEEEIRSVGPAIENAREIFST